MYLIDSASHALMNLLFFFFNDTATTEIYTLSLHDALPISLAEDQAGQPQGSRGQEARPHAGQFAGADPRQRSEEHTSELQSRQYLVCRLLLEKKKKHLLRSLTS